MHTTFVTTTHACCELMQCTPRLYKIQGVCSLSRATPCSQCSAACCFLLFLSRSCERLTERCFAASSANVKVLASRKSVSGYFIIILFILMSNSFPTSQSLTGGRAFSFRGVDLLDSYCEPLACAPHQGIDSIVTS